MHHDKRRGKWPHKIERVEYSTLPVMYQALKYPKIPLMFHNLNTLKKQSEKYPSALYHLKRTKRNHNKQKGGNKERHSKTDKSGIFYSLTQN